MNDRTLAGAVYVVAVLPWIVAARQGWKLRHLRAPYGTIFWTFGVATALVVLHFGVHAAGWLLPQRYWDDTTRIWTPLGLANDLTLMAMMAVSLHGARLLLRNANPPGWRWVAANYGVALLLLVPALTSGVVLSVPALAVPRRIHMVVVQLYVVGVAALIVRWIAQIAVRGSWRPGGLAVPRRADVVALGAALLGVLAFVPLLLLRGPARPSLYLALDVVVGTAFSLPFVVRVFGEVVRAFLITATMLGAAIAVYLGAQALESHAAPADLRPLVDAGAVLVLLLLVVPGQAWVREAVDRLVFRRTRRRRAELQAFLHALSPDLGTAECCTRAVAAVVETTKLRGAALLLDDGQAVAHGDLALAPLAAVWPRGAAAQDLPSRTLIGWALYTLPPALERAVSAADVVGVVPIASPRRRWGHLFVRTDLLRATFSDEDVHALEAFGDQLGLVLDGADLLARAVTVERSLAHAEKLAAIGETAARIAHEIRNPVTAARSLAQQLVRDPASPHRTENAGLILGELERVERQVAALLRFARREELRCEPVDLGVLARATIDAYRPRLLERGVDVVVDAGDEVVVSADREKLRQVLVNLVDNALDALATAPNGRRLTVAVGRAPGVATLGVTDSGSGVPPDALPRLFEPFFSLKETGTGLGLAIARRTVEAHGGHLDAEVPCTGGMTFRMTLPATGARWGR